MLWIPCLQETPRRSRRSWLFKATSLAPHTPHNPPLWAPLSKSLLERQMLSDGMGICIQVARQPVVVLQPPELRTPCLNLIFLAGFHNLWLVAGCNLRGSTELLIVQSKTCLCRRGLLSSTAREISLLTKIENPRSSQEHLILSNAQMLA